MFKSLFLLLFFQQVPLLGSSSFKLQAVRTRWGTGKADGARGSLDDATPTSAKRRRLSASCNPHLDDALLNH